MHRHSSRDGQGGPRSFRFGSSLKSLAFMRVCPKTRNDWAVFKRRGRTFLWGKQPQVRPRPCRATWRFNMNMIKSLVLGSAAGLIALSGAQAADLPVKAKAVEYVRICSLYGAGFYYIPGTDTCIKLGGYVRADVALGTNSVFNGAYNAGGGARNRYSNTYVTRAR